MEIDADTGRIKVTHGAIHRYAFKTPTVRNIALTAPYMHNGQYNTLDEVLDFYKKGGGAGMGVSLQYATLPFDSLLLSPNDVKAIKAFLLALTDSSHLPNAPDRLPQFADEQMNRRKIGGVY
jgi:cytochrome c peroxidase